MNQTMEALDPVSEYVGLDLTELRAELLAGVQRDAASSEIKLSSANARGGGMTPHEEHWFRTHVAPVRGAALARIADDARSILVDGEPGRFAPFEIDVAERSRAQRLREVTQAFGQKNPGLLGDYKERSRSYRRLQNEEGGRDAKVPSYWLEFAGLLPLVMLPEALMNFQSFRKAPMIQSDFMALGVTVIVAIGIAYAAHLFGLFLRRYNYYQRGDDRVRDRSSAPGLWISQSILLVCIAIVAAARYYYIVPQIQQAVVLGMSPPNIYLSIASLLGGNILCFLLGAGFAWALHDENPEFEDVARALAKAKGRLSRAKKQHLDKHVDEIDRRLESDRAAIRKRGRVMQAQPGYAGLERQFQAVRNKDQEVMGALKEYRHQLCEALRARNSGFLFTVEEYTGDPLAIHRTLSLPDFAAEDFHFHYGLSGA